jgi:predicted Zn finger-like uncharacterized protein
MRLACPNCGAQYEVEDALIPPGGRDVQCSACGHAWFFVPPADEGALLPPRPARSASEPAPAQPAPAQPAPAQPALSRRAPPSAPARAPEAAPSAAAARDGGAAAPPAPPEARAWAEAPAEPRRRSLDPAVAEVLREEAEREARARRAAPASIETQPDLGLPAAEPRPRPSVTAPPPRRDLLPDIEEINSTLRPDRDRAPPRRAPDPKAPEPASKGFRRGFALMLLLALALLMAYVFAPRLAELVPAAAGPLAGWVATVDAARAWLLGLAGG